MKGFIASIARKLADTRTSTLLVTGIALVFFAFGFNLIGSQFSRDYGPDDVANQSILQSLVDNRGGYGVFPDDSFVIHFPVYLLTDILMPDNSRAKLFMQAFLLGAFLVACTIFTLIYYLKRTKTYSRFSITVGLLIIGFIFSTPSFAIYMLMINHRQVEGGIMLLLLIAASAFISSAKSPKLTRKNVVLWLAYVMCTGILWYDDPYFMYIMAGGAMLTAGSLWVMKRLSWQKTALVLATLLASALLAKLQVPFFEQLGIHLSHNGNTVILGSSEIITNIQNTLANIFLNFNGGLFGFDILHTSKHTLLPLLAGAMLAIMAIGSFVFAAKRARDKTVALRTILSATALSLILAYCLTKTGTAVVERYFMAIPLLLLPIITEMLTRLQRSQYSRLAYIALAILTTGSLLLLTANARRTVNGFSNSAMATNHSSEVIIDALRLTDYKKGYANFWQAPTVTYLSNGTISSLHALCVDGQAKRVHWLVDNSLAEKPAAKSFLILDTSMRPSEVCTREQADKQFGNPKRTMTRGNASILLYDYDITTKMPVLFVEGSVN